MPKKMTLDDIPDWMLEEYSESRKEEVKEELKKKKKKEEDLLKKGSKALRTRGKYLEKVTKE